MNGIEIILIILIVVGGIIGISLVITKILNHFFDLNKFENKISGVKTNEKDNLYNLRNNKRYKEIPLQRKIELENYVKEIIKKTEITAYIPIKSDKERNIFSSKYGGTPYWDLKEEFPKDNNGNNLVMMAQINFDNEKFEGNEFPNEGMLQFFIGTDNLLGLDFDNPDSQKNWRVVYHPKINYNINEDDILKLDLPVSNLIDETSALSFEKTTDIMESRIYNYCNVEKEIIKEQLSSIEEEYRDEVIEVSYNSPCDKLLGYPQFWQDDPRNRKNLKKYDTLLFQYSTTTDIVFFFFINGEDLKKGDFSKVLYWFDK